MILPGSVNEQLSKLGYTGTVDDKFRAYTKDRLGFTSPSIFDCVNALSKAAGFTHYREYLSNLASLENTDGFEQDALRLLGKNGLPSANTLLELNISEDRNYRSGRRYSITDLLTELRQEPVYVLQSDGTYIERAAEVPAWARYRGLDVFGQFTPKNTDCFDFSATSDWAPAAAFNPQPVNSLFPGKTAYRLTNPGDVGSRNVAQSPGVFSANDEALSVILERDGTSTTKSDIGVYDKDVGDFVVRARYDWGTDTTQLFSGGAGHDETVGHKVLTENGPNGGRCVRFFVTGIADNTGNQKNIFVYPTGIAPNTDSVIIHHGQHLEAPFAGPICDDAGRLADDPGPQKVLRSDGINYQPCAGWEARGLDDGFMLAGAVNVPYLSANVLRFILMFGADTNNYEGLYINTSNSLGHIIVVGGSITYNKVIATLTKTGIYGYAARSKVGDFRYDIVEPDGTALAPVTDSSTPSKPPYAEGKIGRGFASNTQLNAEEAVKNYSIGQTQPDAVQAATAYRAWSQAQ